MTSLRTILFDEDGKPVVDPFPEHTPTVAEMIASPEYAAIKAKLSAAKTAQTSAAE